MVCIEWPLYVHDNATIPINTALFGFMLVEFRLLRSLSFELVCFPI